MSASLRALPTLTTGWASRLRLNPSKTQIMWLGTSQQVDKIIVRDVPLLSTEVTIVDSTSASLSTASCRWMHVLPLSVAVATTSYGNFVQWRGLCQLMLPRHWRRHLYPVDWIIATHCCMASRISPSDTPQQLHSLPCVSEWPSRLPSWSFSVWPARHRRTWRTTVSSPPTSARTDSDQPTQRRASSDDIITVSATGVLRLLDHVCGTCCQFIYGCVTALNSLNGC